eukprot:1035220-Rhodomonas_salina.1
MALARCRWSGGEGGELCGLALVAFMPRFLSLMEWLQGNAMRFSPPSFNEANTSNTEVVPVLPARKFLACYPNVSKTQPRAGTRGTRVPGYHVFPEFLPP